MIQSSQRTDHFTAYGYGPLSQAILFKAEAKVRDLIRTRRSSILERSYFGQTPFHLAVFWPRGIEILLSCYPEATDSLLKCPDLSGNSPLTCALILKQPVSVKLLLDAEPGIDLNNVELFSSLPLKEWNAKQSSEVIQVLTESLAARRNEMLQFAIACLPEDEIDRIDLRRENLLDDKAFEVKQLLSRFGIPLPLHCQTVQPGSVYHSQYMSPILAQKLFEVGFRGTNVTINGYTPIMVTNLCMLANREFLESILDLTAWFKTQGADLNTSLPEKSIDLTKSILERNEPQFRVVHRIAYYLGNSVCRAKLSRIDIRAVGKVSREDRKRIRVLTEILMNTQKDPCICFCTNGGCTPASLFARGIWDMVFGSQCGPREFYSDLYRNLLRQRIKLVDFFAEPYEIPIIAAAVIRVATFNAIGMKHTCCSWVEFSRNNLCSDHTDNDGLVKVMDLAEIREIREEDQYLALLLDALVKEFTAKLIEMCVPFSQFFWEYWWKRMDEIDRERDGLSVKELDALREIGVKIIQ
jgi:hypothetical protein